jgi:ubiquinol-cytochrome c reductase cytochrome c1 subunit
MRHLGFAAVLGLALVGAGAAVAGPARAAEEVELPHEHWSFQGFFGTYDRAALVRGFQVYRDICANCHSLKMIAYRNLVGPGGLGLDEETVKGLAASLPVTDGPDEKGEMFERPGRLSDYIPPPFPNDNAARSNNNGALPPDLSLIVKAREGGTDYLHALLTGYEEPPAGFALLEGMQYNKYFPGHQIAMPPPLSDDGVKYADGTPATVDQMARDVSQFLTWAAEPKLEDRKKTGVGVVLFLIVLTCMLYAVKRKVWAPLH